MLFEQPTPRMRGLRIEPFEGIYLSEHWNSDFAELNQLANATNNWIEVAIVSNSKPNAVLSCRLNHLIAFNHVHSHGLLAHNMFSRARGSNCLDSVQMNRRSDIDGINRCVSD